MNENEYCHGCYFGFPKYTSENGYPDGRPEKATVLCKIMRMPKYTEDDKLECVAYTEVEL